ncbi:MAG: YbjP/YqhG family protein [Clostridium sp.]|nr:YbjP/YqhG family protein [Clostridium sp.]
MMQMVKNLIIIIFVSLFASFGFASKKTAVADDTAVCEKWVVDAYRKWMTHDYRDTLMPKQLFTPEMWAKLGRLSSVTDDDAMLRAQDYSDYGVESVSCSHLEGNWYQVNHTWEEGGVPTVIPVMITKVGDDFRFSYVTPYWGEWQGNSLFDIKSCGKVTQKNALEFMRSFYCNYTYLYATMAPDLEQKLQDMRRKYCTKTMLHSIASTIEEMQGEIGSDCYDPIIMSCDFDIYWFNSLNIEESGADNFIVSYSRFKDHEIRFKVSVVSENGKWMINEVQHI